jgi:hypothetical protein
MTTYNQAILKKDANKNVIQESYHSDMAFLADYTVPTAVYMAYARPGASQSAAVWQLALYTYNVGGKLLSVTWPEAANGAASSEFIFTWSGRAGYTYA